MRRAMTWAMAGVFVLATAAAAPAQQPGHQHDTAAPGGQDHEAQHAQHMMAMCRQMMGQQGMMRGGGMMGGMMGGGTGAPPDPKMLQMRGEMMKAMGEIMLKYGKMMEAGK